MTDPSQKKATSPLPKSARLRQRSGSLARSRDRAIRSASPRATGNAASSGAKAARRWRIAPWLVGSGLLFGTGLVVSTVWLGIQLIVDPNSLSWVNRFLPGSIQIPISDLRPSQTLAEIQAELQSLDLIPGESILLPVKNRLLAGNEAHLLIPVRLQQTNCEQHCQHIVELRVYQPMQTVLLPGQEKSYRLVSQVAVQGIEESFAIAPRQAAHAGGQATSRLLPLTALQKFPGQVPVDGVSTSAASALKASEPLLTVMWFTTILNKHS